MAETNFFEVKTASGNSPIEVFARELLNNTDKELKVVRCKPADLPNI